MCNRFLQELFANLSCCNSQFFRIISRHINATNDFIFGGTGNDTLDGGAGAASMDGGAGIDTVTYISASSRVMLDLQNGAITFGDAIGDTFAGIEMYEASAWGDQLRGDSSANDFAGGHRSDRLYGRAGDDTLDGEGGADAIYGNSGADVMTGGIGAIRDRFIYFNLSESAPGAGNRDIITDFTSMEDRIEISRFDADTGIAGNQAFNLIGAAAFSGVAGELRYEQDGGNNWTLVSVDVDGDTVADWELELTGLHVLVADDFLL